MWMQLVKYILGGLVLASSFNGLGQNIANQAEKDGDLIKKWPLG